MRKTNFYCEDTKEEFFFTSYTISYGANGAVYKDKITGKEIVHPKSKKALKPIEIKGEHNVSFAKFSPGTTEGRKNIKEYFGGRALKFDKKGYGADEKNQRESDFKEQIIERSKDGRM